jgi:hypothetical protein
MSELVKEWRKTQDFKQAYKIGDKMADLIEKQERLLGLYRQMCDYFARHEEEIDCIQMTKLLEKIKQEETL